MPESEGFSQLDMAPPHSDIFMNLDNFDKLNEVAQEDAKLRKEKEGCAESEKDTDTKR